MAATLDNLNAAISGGASQIVGTLNAILLELRNLTRKQDLKRVRMMTPFTYTTTNTTKPKVLYDQPQPGKIVALEIKVRTMGTATYVALGDATGREYRMTADKDYWKPEIPQGYYVQLRDFVVVADQADAVLEIVPWVVD